MAEQYVVYVAAPEHEPTDEARLRLAELLGLDQTKLDALLRRLPAEVTKPVPEGTALTVARRFRQAGLEASVRPLAVENVSASVTDPVPASVEPATRSYIPAEPAAPSHRPAEPAERSYLPEEPSTPSHPPAEPAERSYLPEEPAADEELDEVEEDEEELFPPSSFAQPQGPKAPSRPLLIAFFVVLAILAVLWFLM